MIEFRNITATYKKDVGVFDISFKVEPGELVFLMGPTGAGKSTVLRTIYRAINIDNGQLFVDGEDISSITKSKIPLVRQKIGMIFKDIKLLDNGMHLVCKNNMNRIIQIKFDEIIIFQKISNQEKVILSVLDYLDK